MMIFDGHSDLWEDVDEKRSRGMGHIINTIHAEKWRLGNIGGGFYPIWVDPESERDVKQQAYSILRNMSAELRECSEHVSAVRNYHEFQEAHKAGKYGIFLGAEGLSFLEEPDDLELLYHMGFREASLTWNEENSLACGAGCAVDSGLTEKGKTCVEKMKQLHMIIDLAHTGEKTFWDIIDRVEEPCMVSHGNCRAILNHPRNYTDEQLKAIAERHGIIGISAYPLFISDSPQKQTVEAMVDHVIYAADLIGIEHVGFGFDFVDFLDDVGIDPTISIALKGFACVEESDSLIAELRKRGFCEKELEAICAGNFLRVIRDVLL